MNGLRISNIFGNRNDRSAIDDNTHEGSRQVITLLYGTYRTSSIFMAYDWCNAPATVFCCSIGLKCLDAFLQIFVNAGGYLL